MREPLNIIAAARQSLKSTKNTSTHIIYDKISGKSCLRGSFFFQWFLKKIPVVFGVLSQFQWFLAPVVSESGSSTLLSKLNEICEITLDQVNGQHKLQISWVANYLELLEIANINVDDVVAEGVCSRACHAQTAAPCILT